jgi:hypothetical protein
MYIYRIISVYARIFALSGSRLGRHLDAVVEATTSISISGVRFLERS